MSWFPEPEPFFPFSAEFEPLRYGRSPLISLGAIKQYNGHRSSTQDGSHNTDDNLVCVGERAETMIFGGRSGSRPGGGVGFTRHQLERRSRRGKDEDQVETSNIQMLQSAGEGRIGEMNRMKYRFIRRRQIDETTL